MSNRTCPKSGAVCDCEPDEACAPGPTTHELKCWPDSFRAILNETKRHEVRRFDRPFAPGDVLDLREWNPDSKEYTGWTMTVRVLHVTAPGTWGLPADLCVMSVRPMMVVRTPETREVAP